MGRPIIAIDIDDVLTEGIDSLRQEVNRRLGIQLSLDDYRVRDGEYDGYFDRVWERHGIAGKIDLTELGKQMEVDQSHISPTEGAKAALERLAKHFELIVITDRYERWKSVTLKWLDANYSGIFSAIYFRREMALSKGELCVQLGVAWLVDDNVDHARTALEKGVGVILFGSYGWHANVPEGVVQCEDWRAVEEFLNERAS